MIFNIEVGGTNTTDATASAADILSPKTAYTASGLTSGTMVTRTYPAVAAGTEQGSPIATINFSMHASKLAFSAGYYSQFGWYSIASVANQALPTSTSNTPIGSSKGLNIADSANKYINIPVGYLSSSAYYTISMMTLPTTTAATGTGTQKATIGKSTLNQYINIPNGYNATSAYYKIEGIANGTAATPATTITANPTFSFDASTGELTATVNASSSISPTVTEGYVSEGTAGTVSAAGTGIYSMTVMTLPTSPTTTRISQYEIGRTTVSTTDMYLNIPQGYNSRSGFYTVQSAATMTLPTSAITTSTGTLKSTIDRSTATRYLNIPTGYNSASAYYKISSVPNVTMPTTTYSTPIQGTNIATFGAYSYSQYLFIPSGYVQGGSYYTISGDRNLIAGNIKSGTSIFGVEGTYYGVDTTDATATADQIYSGATAYISTGKVSGTMPNITLPTTFPTTPTGTNIGGINRSNTTRYLNVPQGYHTRSEYYTIASVPDMTLSQDTSTTSVGTFVSQLANLLNTSTYLNIPAGYLSSSSYYKMPYVSQQVLPTSTSNTYEGTNKLVVIPTTANQYINIPVGYNTQSANYNIRGSEDLIPENIKSGVTLFNVEGTLDAGFTLNEIGLSQVSGMNAAVSLGAVNSWRAGGYAQTSITALDCAQVTSTSVPNSFASGCNRLTTVALNSSKTTAVGASAFNRCTLLQSITGTESITWISPFAFEWTGLSEITSEMFSQTGWVSVLANAFASCKMVTVDMPRISTLTGGVTGSFTNQLQFGFCTSLETVSMANLSYIAAPYAFSGCTHLVNVSMPNLLMINGSSAFVNCSALSTLNFPKLTSLVGYSIFANCSALTSISLPALTTLSGTNIFANVGLSSIELTNALSVLSGSPIFASCANLSRISIANFASTTSTLVYIIQKCPALEYVYIGGSFSGINTQTFYSCPVLTKIDLPDMSGTIAAGAISACPNLREINAPNVKSFNATIGINVGAGSVFSSISIPKALSIGGTAFANCVALSNIALPAVTYIAASAFSGCTNLISLDLTGVSSVPSLANVNAFNSTPLYNYSAAAGTWGSIYVPASLYNSFIAKANWSNASIKARIVSV